jgi:hypothetical protein
MVLEFVGENLIDRASDIGIVRTIVVNEKAPGQR